MTADIIKPISVTRLELPIKIPTVQSDTGRRIIFVMTDLDIPDGGTAQIYAKKPSGAEIYNNCTVGNLPTGASTVTVQLTSAMLEEAGDFMAQIQVVSGNDVVTSFVFTISNAKNLVNDSAAEGSNEYNALVEATQEALDAAQEALDAAAQVGDISSKTVTFQQAAQRANIQSGDTLAVAFGKLAKYCADLKEAAYQGTANNLTTTEEGKVLDARQGKELKDQIGDLDELETSEKENLVGAVNELNTKRTWQKLAEQTSLGAWEDHAVDNLSQYNEIAVIAYDTTGSFATYILATALFTGTTNQIPFGGHAPQGQGFGLSRYLNNETIGLFTSPSSSKTELYGIL